MALAIPVIGVVVVLSGLVYDVMFAGIPYQDPTPELQANYVFHASIAGVLYKSGAIIILVGLLATPFVWRKCRK